MAPSRFSVSEMMGGDDSPRKPSDKRGSSKRLKTANYVNADNPLSPSALPQPHNKAGMGTDSSLENPFSPGRHQSVHSTHGHPHHRNELSLRDYYEVILRFRWSSLSVFLIVLSLSILKYYYTPKSYQASLKMIKSGSSGAQSFIPLPGMAMGKYSELSTEAIIEIFNAGKVYRHAIDSQVFAGEFKRLSERHPEEVTAAEISRAAEMDADLAAGATSISTVDLNIFLVKSVVTEAPFIAAAVTNAMADSLISILRDMSLQDSYKRIATLEKLIREQESKIEKIDETLRVLSQSNTAAENKEFHGSIDENKALVQLEEYEQKRQQQMLLQKGLEQKCISIRKEFNIVDIPVDQVQFLDSKSSLARQMQDLKFKRQELSTRYREINPSIKKLDNQIRSLEETLKPKASGNVTYVEVDSFQSGLVADLLSYQSELEAIRDQIEYLDLKIKGINIRLLDVPPEVREYRKLSMNKVIMSGLLDGLHQSLQEEKVSSISVDDQLTIVEKASPDFRSSSASLGKFIAIGITLGLALGFGTAFLLHNWSNTVSTSTDLKKLFTYPVLGAIPITTGENKYIENMKPDSANAEVYGTIRTNIRFSSSNNPEKCLMLASALQGEGKSYTAVNLCLSFVLEGNSAILISGDIRKPFTYMKSRRKEDLKRSEGIVEYLEGEATMEQIIYPSDTEGFHFIPTCKRAKNPTRVLRGTRMKELIDHLQNIYDVVIIDTAAVLPVIDACLIAPLVRGVALLVKAKSTDTQSVQNALARLEYVNSPTIGLILNQVTDLKLETFYSYNNSSYYQKKGKKNKSTQAPSHA